MFLLPLVCAGMLYACGGDDEQPTPDPEKDTLTVAPTSLTFEAADTKTETVTVEKTAATYEPVCEAAWVEITQGNNSFTVKVKEYTYAEAELAEFKSRSATITVKSGDADDATVSVTQASPEQIVYTLTTDPESIVFQPGETTTTVEITTNASNVEVNIPAEFGWITDAVITANILSVTVDYYIGTEDNVGYVLLSSVDLEEDYKLNITQKPVAPLDIAGTWNWTGTPVTTNNYAKAEGELTIVYDETLECYVASSLTEFLTWASVSNIGEGGLAFHVDAKNNVTFVFGQKQNLYGYYNFMDMMEYSFSFRNSVSYRQGDTRYYDPLETAYTINVSGDGNTMTFPKEGVYEDVTYPMVFGFYGVNCNKDTHEESGNPVHSAGGLWYDLVLTRAE